MNSEKIKEILNAYNKFWTTGLIEAGIERTVLADCLRQIDTKETIVLKGIRRSGKSTLMAQVIQHLLRSGVSPSSILRVNLDEPLFAADYSIDLLERLYRTYRESINPADRCYLFLDEIQNVPGWEQWVRGRSETENIKIFATGSSSRVLSPEIGTKLTGRQISFTIFPLSFSEYLRFQDLDIDTEQEYRTRKPVVRKSFTDYLRYGGFPEVALKPDPEDKDLLLKHYFEDIVYRDVVSRYQIRDTLTLKNLAVYLLANIGNLTSVTKLKNNFGISQDKVENYWSALVESYLLSPLLKFSYSAKIRARAGFKVYAVDTGVRNRIAFSFSGDTGRLVENVVFNHLRQVHEEICYETNGHETDFLVKEGTAVTRRIQVWYGDPAETEIPARESAPFAKSFAAAAGGENLILTNDLEGEITIGSEKVRSLPVIKFLCGWV
ncbi:MAG: ATP-binding protein [Thermodesulfobacteriota bacterium]